MAKIMVLLSTVLLALLTALLFSPPCPPALLASALLAVFLHSYLSSLSSCTALLCSPRCPPAVLSSALIAVLLHSSPLLSSLSSYTVLLRSPRCPPALLSFALLLLPCFKTTGETSNGVTTGEAHRPIARLHASNRFSLWQNARVA